MQYYQDFVLRCVNYNKNKGKCVGGGMGGDLKTINHC